MSDGMSEAFGTSYRAQKDSGKKYLVFYVLKGKPALKRFASKKEALKFANKIQSRSDFYNWVDYIVKGEILLKGHV
jgi:hypothetical protein